MQHSATPTPLVEHEDEHEHEDDFDAPGEGDLSLRIYPGLKPRAESSSPFGTKAEMREFIAPYLSILCTIESTTFLSSTPLDRSGK
jgi:hypothetical protein